MNIVFIVACKFPYGSASSARALNLCKLLNKSGFCIHVISDYASLQQNSLDCCTFESINDKAESLLKRREKVRKIVRTLQKYCDCHQVDAVLMNSAFDRFYDIAKFCKDNHKKLYIENCEWGHYSGFKLGFLDIRYWKYRWMMCNSFKKANGAISISRFLHKHNESLGLKSVRIPTIMDIESTPYNFHSFGEKINIIYAGSIGRSKEWLYPVIWNLANDDELRKKVVFHVYGPTRKQVLRNIHYKFSILKKADDSVVIHGRKMQEEMQSIFMTADYTLFIRPNRKSSHAGFPTKLGESMAAGTPVITNDTGDICLYLKNGKNGFVVDGNEKEALRTVLKKLSEISSNDYVKMRENARKTSEESFDYKNYINEIRQLME